VVVGSAELGWDDVAGGHWLVVDVLLDHWLWDNLLLNHWLHHGLGGHHDLGLHDWGLHDWGLHDWLLDHLLLLGWVDDLSFNGLVFDSFLDSLLWDVLGVDSFLWDHVDESVGVGVGNILGLMFDDLVFGDSFFMGNDLGSLDWFVFHVRGLIRDIFDS